MDDQAREVLARMLAICEETYPNFTATEAKLMAFEEMLDGMPAAVIAQRFRSHLSVSKWGPTVSEILTPETGDKEIERLALPGESWDTARRRIRQDKSRQYEQENDLLAGAVKLLGSGK